MQQSVPRALALMYPDGSVDVLPIEDRDDVEPGFISQLEFTIPDEHGTPWEWDRVETLGRSKIREKVAILPDGNFGDRGQCRGCGEQVVFVRLPSGKRPPFNYDGESHFTTCPDADRWRTTQPRSATR